MTGRAVQLRTPAAVLAECDDGWARALEALRSRDLATFDALVARNNELAKEYAQIVTALERDQERQVGRMVAQMRRADIAWKVIEASFGRSRRHLMRFAEVAVPAFADRDGAACASDAQNVVCNDAAHA